ncbi:glycerate kinase [Pelagerythrobacter rhizovicinus]|uniref:Glycerate kinase n=1 Tax=Pelagerythrobacter rhizovicinus TaxID=2268576 RepID=A0A4Q2KNN6_9SPHN|nr:glycerate kinase [Pelagerythrobacter rhizovicinus]
MEGGAAAPCPRRALLRRLFDTAVASAQPDRCIPPALPSPPRGRTIVVGAGKAAAAMALAVERHWRGPLEGLVITRHSHGAPCRRIGVREAGHPVPDAAGIAATREMFSVLDGVTEDDLVLCLLSGGGSALLAAPPSGVSLEDLQALSRALLRSGATIAQINRVRRHLSMAANGGLAERARPAKLVTLAISDVPGDDAAMIASGPTTSDGSTGHDALATLDALGIVPVPSVRYWLESEPRGAAAVQETAEFHLIASPQMALEAAAQAARDAGYPSLILGSAIEGEAREVATVHAGIALQAKRYGQPLAPPCILLSGGETSVTVCADGRGGRNSEFLLALLQALDGEAGIYALAADTDGIDGTGPHAGAAIGPDTPARARAQGISAAKALAENDSRTFFAAVGALVETGPTFTNVNDFRAILIDAAPGDRSPPE